MYDMKKILIVEDDPKDELLIRRSLKNAGLINPIVVANDGERALDALFPKDGSEGMQPALILLDLMLPRISGVDVLKKIRTEKRTRKIPVVILTSSDEPYDIDSCYTCGANSYVRKPVNFDDFSKAVERVGLYWILTNESPETECS